MGNSERRHGKDDRVAYIATKQVGPIKRGHAIKGK